MAGFGGVSSVVNMDARDARDVLEDANLGGTSLGSEAGFGIGASPSLGASGGGEPQDNAHAVNPVVGRSQPPVTTTTPTPSQQAINKKSLVFRPVPRQDLWETLLAIGAAARVTYQCLVTWETVIAAVLAAAFTLLFTFVPSPPEIPGQQQSSPSPLATNLNLTFYALVLVFPLTSNIQFAFQRREKALVALASLRGNLMCILIAQRDWDWPCKNNSFTGRRDGTGGEAAPTPMNAEQHVADVRAVLVLLAHSIRDFLALPILGRNMHLFTKRGIEERNRWRPMKDELLRDVDLRFAQLSMAVEKLKAHGMPGNEATRLNQYLQLTLIQFEQLKYIKNYHTPHALRAFARVFILAHIPFTGPYYANVAVQSSLAFAICLNIFTVTCMVGLLNVAVALEDPFDQRVGLDNVRVSRAFSDLETSLLETVPLRHEYVRGEISLLDVTIGDASSSAADGTAHRRRMPPLDPTYADSDILRTKDAQREFGASHLSCLLELSEVHESAMMRAAFRNGRKG